MRRVFAIVAGLLGIAALAGPTAASAAPPPSYIVRVSDAAANSALVRAERRRGTRITHVFRRSMVGFAATLTRADVARLRRVRSVIGVSRNAVMIAGQAPTHRHTALGGQWALDRIDQRTTPLDGHFIAASTGAGVDAYVIDSGIRAGQVQFAGRLRAGQSLVADGNGTEDCNGHGTRVSGVIAGSETGVAPEAGLIPVRVLDCRGAGSTAALIAGIDWVIGHHRAGAPAVANISLYGPRNRALNDAVAALVADGVVVTVAAGNQAADACAASPSSAPLALTVAASTEGDQQAAFSDSGSCVDVFAPGDAVLTTFRSRRGKSSHQVGLAAGTSISAAFVAGAAALRLSLQPSMSPDALTQALLSDATPDVLAGVAPGTPNLLLYVGTGAATGPAPVQVAADTVPVLSRLRARFAPRRGTSTGRYRITGATTQAGVVTVTRAGRLLSRRHVRPGAFTTRSRSAPRVGTVRVQLRPDDRALPMASAAVRVPRR